jgi:hypothetical protein
MATRPFTYCGPNPDGAEAITSLRFFADRELDPSRRNALSCNIELVAVRIVELTSAGESDPDRLIECTVATFQ